MTKRTARGRLNIAALRFTCQPGCTKCCERHGYVYLTEEDLVRAATYLRMPAAEFEQRYVQRFRQSRRLRKPKDGRQCSFLAPGKGCAIHPAKPTQCRLYPFWPELLPAKRWRSEAQFCPGIGKGELIQIESAHAIARGMDAYQ